MVAATAVQALAVVEAAIAETAAAAVVTAPLCLAQDTGLADLQAIPVVGVVLTRAVRSIRGWRA